MNFCEALQNNFLINGRKSTAALDADGFKIECDGFPNLTRQYCIGEIVSCWVCPKGKVSCCPTLQQQQPSEGRPDSDFNLECKGGLCHHTSGEKWKGLSVEVCERCPAPRVTRKWRWTNRVIVLKNLSMDVLVTWREVIWRRLQALSERPGRLVVIVNPAGGSKKAAKIYEKKIKPFFQRAAIRTSMYQTSYKGHGTDLVQKLSEEGSLKDIDGLVAVGGDGSVSDIAMGLFIIASKDSNTDPNADLPVTPLRIGIVPSGSTDAICYATHGNNDVITSILHIIMGDQRCIDVATVHSGDKLVRIVCSMLSYGYLGDLLKFSENYRWMGPPRYTFSGLRQLLKNRSYSVSIKAKALQESDLASTSSLLDSSTCNMVKSRTCSSLCSTCLSDEEFPGQKSEDYVWKEFNGKYSLIEAVMISCACKMAPYGVSPSAHLGDGHLDLILVSGETRMKFLTYLYNVMCTGNHFRLNHVDMVRTSEIHFTASPNSFSFNCDGELFQAPSVSIKTHQQKLKLFCRGIEEPWVLNNLKENSCEL